MAWCVVYLELLRSGGDAFGVGAQVGMRLKRVDEDARLPLGRCDNEQIHQRTIFGY